MSIFTRLRHLLGGQKELSPEDLAREEELKKQLRERCARFRRLLSSNKNALEIMSEVEEALAGSRPFGMSYVRGAGTRAATAVYQMVRELNALSDNQYESLQTAFNDVSGRITDVLERKSLVTDGPLLLPLTDIRLGDMPQVGGKMANLGEVSANVGLAVPDGFAVTVNAYHAFMEYNGLRDEISRRIQSADMDSMDDLFSLSAALQQCILNAPLPPQLEQAIEEAVAGMVERCGSELRLALRSSAVGEDALGVTFAGQYRSELNVLPEEACEVWKEIVASKYAVTAMSYRFQRGIPDEAAPMSVGVLSMVQALAGGEKGKKAEYYDRIYVGWWDGTQTPNGKLPHPYVEDIEIAEDWSNFLNIHFSLRINHTTLNRRRTVHSINTRQKTTFKFLSDNIPNPRAVFFIKGKKYLCEKMTATFTENGMSQLIKGVFYPIVED